VLHPTHASGRARAKCDVDVKVVRVLTNPIGVANRVRWMKPAVAIFGRLHNMRKNFTVT